MRKYKYQAVLQVLNPVTHEKEGKILYPVYGESKADAINNIDVCFPCVVESCKRVNITDRKREKRFLSFACVDMGQCSRW